MSEKSYTVTLSEQELRYCIKGVGALGMIWNKQARKETEKDREDLRQKLISLREQQETPK